ncbi:MAG: membrane-bound lytic murein transglycosylase B [bacterium]|nr:MAG: membrane-bound lytic murein transglycosylase B [bacterium]KAF0148073.1 MAG: membrane-bound lytic murein transglycosylase B [bacterium]KAF0167589.1 MAG: membrane-bound lytic murein transglycosylase B [bacterium]TXT17468.1 MAG: membrane-bound lytic murein transglycosylase B [bacterium]
MRRLAALACLALLAATARADVDADFSAWLRELSREAQTRGISATTFEAALGDAQPIPRVLELDRRQPEFAQTFWNYLDARLTDKQIRQGRDMLWTHRKLLARMQARHGIPPALLVALWGMETRYGAYTGSFPIPAALATLAHDGRRAAFFREELFNALRILEDGHIAAADMTGSWAGAMGQLQFMPSTFLAHAVDADRDGRKDLWRSLPDAFASAAGYLSVLGWRADELWGREVRLPAGFDHALAHPENKLPVRRWAALGVTTAEGKPLPRSDMAGAILLPQGHAGPAFLVYRNFEVILTWNRSVHYALSVTLLADRLRGSEGPLLGRDADNRTLSREDILELQDLLLRLGHELGEPDGVAGRRTRDAVRRFQKDAGLPVDGFVSHSLLERLRDSHADAGQATPVGMSLS